MSNWGSRFGAWIEHLRRTRPVFQSKSDLVHSPAHSIRACDPPLELHPGEGRGTERVDLRVSIPASGVHLALRLRYPRAAWTGTVAGERFALKNHSAQDLTCYDVVRDIRDLEQLSDHHLGWSGGVLLLTNDPLYWKHPDHHRPAIHDAFRLYEGAHLAGVRAWRPYAGQGTTAKREEALALRGAYRCTWSWYSRFEGRRGDFRLLTVPIGRRTPP
ncbi:hypothetical protein ACIBFB_19975 [Nocardiopsis sp. NPDC050513]|uniref:hypothetical protein n=1 Tax=Nocardiopsis sp. NPDC050513 TaxID=3364338 RepID=UPI003787E62B